MENGGQGEVDGRRARLDGSRRLRVRLQSDGRGTLRLELPLPEGARVERVAGPPLGAGAAGRSRARAAAAAPEVALDRAGASFTVASGTREYVIDAAGSEAGSPDAPRADEPEGRRSRDGGAEGTAAGGASGELPFTGLALVLVLLAGVALTATGRALRRRS